MKRVVCCLMVFAAFVCGVVACPAPPGSEVVDESSRSEKAFEQPADGVVGGDGGQEVSPDGRGDAGEDQPETPVSEQPPEVIDQADQTGPKTCPRGKLYDEQKDSCIDFPVSELVSEEIKFTNPQDGVSLSGTLLKPKVGAGVRLPAIVFIHGSGPNDRDETASGALGVQLPKPVKVFKDLASFFAARGYVTFRYDKRTYGVKDPKVAEAWTVDSFTQDASAAFDMLKQRDDVRGDDLIVMGHSQGGTLVLDLAASRDDIKSVVILAGASGSLKDLLLAQFHQIIAWLEKTPPSTQRDQQIASYKAKIELYEKTLPAIADGTYQSSTFEGASTAFWKSWIENHSRIEARLKALKQPVAGLSGTLDFNIPPAQTQQLKAWRGDRKEDFFKVYEGLTHLLNHVAGNQVGESVHQPLMTELLAWLNGQVGASAP